jgi:hypothetical protein
VPHQNGTCVLATATALVIGSVIGTGVFAIPPRWQRRPRLGWTACSTTITAPPHSEQGEPWKKRR